MKLNHLFTYLSLLTASLLPAPAADTDAWLKNGLIHPEVIIKHHSELKLSPDQETKLMAMVEPAKTNVATLEEAVKKAQQELETLLRNPDANTDEAASKLTAALTAEGALKQFQLRTLIEFRRVLTPEQRTQALALAATKGGSGSDMEAKIRSKAERLKTAYEALGLPMTEGLRKRGQQIEEMIKNGGLERAMGALEKLAADSGLDKPLTKAELDFSKLEPGDTDLEKLKARLDSLQERAKEVVSVEIIGKLMQAREALEKAKNDSNADLAGRILTFAEDLLEKK
jgi:Spy/CpxP family protein refolding chaperone